MDGQPIGQMPGRATAAGKSFEYIGELRSSGFSDGKMEGKCQMRDLSCAKKAANVGRKERSIAAKESGVLEIAERV